MRAAARRRPGRNRRHGPAARSAFAAAVLGAAALAGALRAAELASAPLAPRSRAGTTLFSPLTPAQTGIVAENPYDDPRMWTDRYQELVYGAIGSGVAIGDFDDDGRPDLYLVNKTGPGRLFRNLGDWRFEDVTERSGLGAAGWMGGLFGGDEAKAWTQGAAWADVNNDGRLDLYICRFAAPNRLYINQGGGAGSATFKEEAEARGLALTDASGMAAFADYDRDGWLDVYVQTNMLSAKASPEGQRDRLFRNLGDGKFADVTDRAGIRGLTLGHAATWWDFDEDGWPDLYVANDYAGPDRLYRNNRDGTFTDVRDRALPRTPYYSMGADLGDVNNDGRLDLLVADMAATTPAKDQRGMAGSRARAQAEPLDPAEAPQRMSNALYLNTGTGRLHEAAFLAGVSASDWTWSARLEDLDCDGRVDVHFTNGMVREYHNADLLERIMGAEGTDESRQMVKASPVLAERNLAFRNLGGLRFEECGRAWGLDQPGVSFGAAFGDLDGDGDLDLVFANYQAGPTVLRNDAPAGNRLVVALRGTRSNRFGAGATVRVRTAAGEQVRALVLARGYLSSSEPVLHFGLGEAETVEELIVDWPSGHRQRFDKVAAGQKLTIAEPASAPASRTGPEPSRTLFDKVAGDGLAAVPEETEPDRDAQPLAPFRLDRRGPALAAADLDGDGRDELVVGGTTKSPLLLGQLGALAAGNADDGPVLLLDFDGDGDADLLRTKAGASRSGNHQPQLWRNDGGRFTPTDAIPALAISAGAAAAADFDRDGDLDLFLGARNQPGRYPHAAPSFLLRNEAGRFSDVSEAFAPALRTAGLVTSALWTDADDDGWPDLLIATEWGEVRFFRGEAGQALVERGDAAGFRAAGTGLWTSLAAADLNRDGRMDYVAGNLGLNTPYQPSAALFVADFRGGSPPQLVEARTFEGRLLPLRTRAELGALIPGILRKFPKNDAYANASLEEILGAGKLAAARKFEATELRSGVFLSQPNGTWRFEPLPVEAQLAPLQGIVAGDLDADGHADVLAAQNSFAQPASMGRFDGGLGVFLRGDGRGGFRAVGPAESGLVIPGDARAVILADRDRDGAPEILVSRNRQEGLAFAPAGGGERRWFRVVLDGPPGNPTGIGAKLTLELADGKTLLAEVAAGSGVLSQSAAGAFFGYSAANVPRRLIVRWPDGRTATHAFPAPPAGNVFLK